MANRKNGSNFLPGVQALRALAALLVLACHVIAEFAKYGAQPNRWDNLATIGSSGVDLFFTISGFVIFYTAFGSQRPSLSPAYFLKMRFIRIYPLYWLTLAGVLAVHAIGFLRGQPVTFVGLFLDATLLPHQEPLVFVSWTLSYELFFYLVFAATLPLRSRTLSLVVTTGAIVLALLAGRLLPEENALRAFLTHNVMLEFCLGMALAFVFVKWPEMPLPKAWMIGPLLALVAAMPWLAVHQEGAAPEPRALLWGCLSVAILACSLRDWDPRSSLAKLIVLLGGGSYAIYLFHLFPLIVYGYVMREGLLPGWAWAPLGGLFFIGSIAASLAIHIAIERPIMRLLRRSRNPDAAGFVPIARPSADSASNYDAESDKTPPPTPSTI